MEQIDWSKAPEGATHYLPRGVAGNNACWYIVRDTDMAVMRASVDNGDWTWRHIDEYDRKHFIPAAIPRPTTWNGEGLPPVGTICTYGGNEGVIVAHVTRNGLSKAIIQDDNNWWSGIAEDFLPLRTPEQIAAEEREKAIGQMMEDYKYKEGPCTHHLLRSQAERIYDAGYRKVDPAK